TPALEGIAGRRAFPAALLGRREVADRDGALAGGVVRHAGRDAVGCASHRLVAVAVTRAVVVRRTGTEVDDAAAVGAALVGRAARDSACDPAVAPAARVASGVEMG